MQDSDFDIIESQYVLEINTFYSQNQLFWYVMFQSTVIYRSLLAFVGAYFIVPALCILVMFVLLSPVFQCTVLCCSCPLCCRRLLCCQSQHRPSVTWLEPGNYLAWRLLPLSCKPRRALLMPNCINDFGHSAPVKDREAEGHSCIFR